MTEITESRFTLGIDRAVGWTVAARVWSMLAGPISVFLIASRLSPDEQGFYYTFGSIISFQVMIELGLGLVIVQFASHEKAFLTWQPDGTVTGSDVEKGRLAALLRKTLRWYAIASAITAAALLIGGSLFFALESTSVREWPAPWIAVAILTGAMLFLTPFLSILEGCGLVIEVARVRTVQVIASNLAGWSVLLGGGKLWASPAISAAALVAGTAWLIGYHRHFFVDLLHTRGDGISWRDEIWPFQWRIALSWIANYFMFNLFVPVLFAARGPAAAGRMGMSLTLAATVYFISNALVTTKVPRFGALIARREFAELDALFFPAMRRSIAVMALGAVALLGGTLALQAIGHRWSTRLLEPLPFALMLTTMIANTIFFSMAVYLRAHKQEPLLGVFIASAIAIAASTLILGRAYGATGMMLGYLASTLAVSLGAGALVFLRKRREWHA